MTLGLTQSPMKMSTSNIPGGNGGRCIRVTPSPPSHAESLEIWVTTPPGTLWSPAGLEQGYFAFYIYI